MVGIKGKVEQSRERSSSYRKGSLQVTLDLGRQLYFLYCSFLFSTKTTLIQPRHLEETIQTMKFY